MLKEDAGHAGVIESTPATLMSSHAVKRFFSAFSFVRIWFFSVLLQGLFIWRLNLKNTDVIELFIDTIDELLAHVGQKQLLNAAKIAKTSGEIILKVTSATWKNLKFDVLWKRSGAPPRFALA